MRNEHLRPSKKDIDDALKVESMVPKDLLPKYMEWLNNRPMSHRTEARDQRDGCILTGLYWRYCVGKTDDDYP